MKRFGQWFLEAESIINRLRFEHSQVTERTKRGVFPAIAINAWIDTKPVGDIYLVNENNEWIVYGVNVLPDFQRRGIATALYRYAENLLNIKIKPSPSQTDDGKAFWQSRS